MYKTCVSVAGRRKGGRGVCELEGVCVCLEDELVEKARKEELCTVVP